MGAQPSAEDEEEAEPVPVFLHVYDVGQDFQIRAVNSVLEAIGTGAFHCGVEVYRHEFSFNWKAQGTGVFKCRPRRCPGHTYRTTVPMGYTLMSSKQIERLLYVLKEEWQGKEYNILTRNCCAFCDVLCRALGVGPIPGWTTSLAGTAAAISDVCHKVANTPTTVQETWQSLSNSMSFVLWNCRPPCDRPKGAQVVMRDFVVEGGKPRPVFSDDRRTMVMREATI